MKDMWKTTPEQDRGESTPKTSPKCATDTEQHGQNANARPSNNCNFKHNGPNQLQSHLFYHCPRKTYYANSTAWQTAQENRTRMIHTGVPEENMTCLKNNMTYNAGTQQWVRNICNKTEQPQDIRNVIRNILWHIRRQQVTEQENPNQYTLEPITYIQELRIETLLPHSAKTTTMQETPDPERKMPNTPAETLNQDRRNREQKLYGGSKICKTE